MKCPLVSYTVCVNHSLEKAYEESPEKLSSLDSSIITGETIFTRLTYASPEKPFTPRIIITSTLNKASSHCTTVWPGGPSKKILWQDFIERWRSHHRCFQIRCAVSPEKMFSLDLSISQWSRTHVQTLAARAFSLCALSPSTPSEW